MAKRTTFIGYIDRVDYIEAMTNEELGILFRKILQHVAEEEEIELPPEIKIMRAKIKKQLDGDKDKWESVVESKSKAGSNHKGNQYTKGDNKRNTKGKAQKMAVEQMEQNGTNGTHLICNNNIYSSSSKKEEKNIRKEEREKMLEVFRKNEKLIRFIDEVDAIRWRDYKQSSKKPYKDIDTFMTALVKMKNVVKDYGGMPKSDRNRRNRFNFAVNEAIEKGREGLNRYDYMEPIYESSKEDLYPTPKQNE